MYFNNVKKYVLTGIFIVFVLFPGIAQNTTKINGNWIGELDLPGQKLEIIFKIATVAKGELKATMDVPQQAARDIPVNTIRFANDSLELTVNVINGSFSGVYQPDTTVKGKWKQSGMEFSTVLSKTRKVREIRRPQTPQKPFRYIVEEVEYVNKKSGFKLAGTLTLPATTKKSPAVILISGSGAQDRDETLFEHKPFLVIADYLTKNGIAVLRVDDRGVGGSEGKLIDATSEDFAGDVLAGIDFLKSHKDIDNKKIGLIGHSEGGIVAPLAANKSSDVSFIILMAGSGVEGKQVIFEQGELIGRAAGMSELMIQQNKKLQEAIFTILQTEPDAAARAVKLQKAYTNGMYDSMNPNQKNAVDAAIAGVDHAWFRFFLNYNPYPALTKLKCPVLALNGEKDLQVPAKTNLAAIEKALTEGKNSNFKIVEMAGLNHLFQKCETGAISEYAQIEETINPEVLKLMKDWILEVNSK